MTKTEHEEPHKHFNLILTKYLELYDKEQLQNFPDSMLVYVDENIDSCVLKYEFNKNIAKESVKSMNDVYKLIYNICESLNEDV